MGNASAPAITGIVIGIAIGVGVGWAFLSPQHLLPPQSEEPFIGSPEPAFVASEDPDAQDRLARIEAQLQRVMDALEGLDRQVAALSDRPERTPVAGQAIPARVDEDDLVRAFARVEENRLLGLSNDGLLRESQRLAKMESDEAAQRTLEMLLARSLDPDDRSAALLELGMLHRRTRDLNSSAFALQEAVDIAGLETPEGAWAGFQLMMTRQDLGQQADALMLADSVARSENSKEWVTTRARWQGARIAHDLGDTVRARADYQAILAEFGDDPDYQDVIKDVRQRLATLR